MLGRPVAEEHVVGEKGGGFFRPETLSRPRHERALRLLLGLAWAARALDDACAEGEHDVRLRPSRLDDGGARVMEFTADDLRTFVRDVWDDGLAENTGGMGAPDLFTLYVALKTLRPKVVVESGVFNGISTRLIRRVLPEATIICLDPRAIDAFGYVDASERTTYHIARDFVDFEKLDLSAYNRDEVLVFFDDHQDAYDRVLQSAAKGITDVFFNDNYPLDSGGHYTLEARAELKNERYWGRPRLEPTISFFSYANFAPGLN